MHALVSILVAAASIIAIADRSPHYVIPLDELTLPELFTTEIIRREHEAISGFSGSLHTEDACLAILTEERAIASAIDRVKAAPAPILPQQRIGKQRFRFLVGIAELNMLLISDAVENRGCRRSA